MDPMFQVCFAESHFLETLPPSRMVLKISVAAIACLSTWALAHDLPLWNPGESSFPLSIPICVPTHFPFHTSSFCATCLAVGVGEVESGVIDLTQSEKMNDGWEIQGAA